VLRTRLTLLLELMSLWEISPLCSKVGAMEALSAWAWERLPVTTEPSNSIGLRCQVQTILSFRKICIA
jgi:hypothetical protein